MAVLCALFATTLLMGLGVSVMLMGTAETTLAAQDRTARALREASLAALHLAVSDLRLQADWSAVLAAGSVPPFSAAPGRAIDPGVTPVAPWGGAPLDLRLLTAAVAAEANTGSGGPQVWRLFECGSLEGLAPGAPGNPWYIAAWVADDRADADANPLTDSNGTLALRAVAYGPGGAAVATAATVLKTAPPGVPGGVRILTIRPQA